MAKGELAELKTLQDEILRLSAVVASEALEIEAYKELPKGKR